MADKFFAAVVRQAKLRRYISSDHFSVDGTLLEAWASHKSFKPKDQPPPSEPPVGRNDEVQWHGEKRSNETHASTTDPEARLARKSAGTASKLCYAGHLLMENRSALIVDAELTAATGYAERDTATDMLARLPDSKRRRTVAADKAYDTKDFVAATRQGRLHTARRPEHDEPAFGNRRAHDPTPRTSRQPTDPQTDRGTLRLDQDHRRRTQTPLHRPTTQPGLVPNHRRCLQPHPHHHPRHCTRLTSRTPARPRQFHEPNHRNRRPTCQADPTPHRPPTARRRHSNPDFQHPVNCRSRSSRYGMPAEERGAGGCAPLGWLAVHVLAHAYGFGAASRGGDDGVAVRGCVRRWR